MMIINDKLAVFENFQRDLTLPKFNTKTADLDDDGKYITINTAKALVVSGGDSVEWGSARRPSWWRRLTAWFLTRREDAKRTVSIEEFFRSVKGAANEIKIMEERALGLKVQLERTKKSGQVALREQLERSVGAERAEAQLVALGMKCYVEEDTIVTFAQRVQRGVELSWLCNFVRHIPDDVLERKFQSDERGIFDAYCVLHYDPEKKSVHETQAERDRRKDPILFGLIEGRRRLYFVGDWVDEYCDLTLDQLAEKLGSAVKNPIRSLD
jgi:hypothetical protein